MHLLEAGVILSLVVAAYNLAKNATLRADFEGYVTKIETEAKAEAAKIEAAAKADLSKVVAEVKKLV